MELKPPVGGVGRSPRYILLIVPYGIETAERGGIHQGRISF